MNKIHNFLVDFLSFMRKYLYILCAVFTAIIMYFLFYSYGLMSILVAKQNIASDITVISVTLAGFLFAGHSILISLPKNDRFIKLLYEQGWFVIIFRTLFIGEVLLFITMILGITGLYFKQMIWLFFIGVSYSILSIYLIYRISIIMGRKASN